MFIAGFLLFMGVLAAIVVVSLAIPAGFIAIKVGSKLLAETLPMIIAFGLMFIVVKSIQALYQ